MIWDSVLCTCSRNTGDSGNDQFGCRPCECDFGGSLNNRCMMGNGQCDCRRHLIGRQCSEVQPGYFCAPLDYYKYEAEDANGRSPTDSALRGKVRPQAADDCIQHLSNQARRHRRHRRVSSSQQYHTALRRIRQLQQTPDVTTVNREHTPGMVVTWTGPGFARVKDGAGLVFSIDNIPHAMEYHIMLRYEPESPEDWEAVVSITSVNLPSSLRCGNLLPTEQLYTETLLHQNRYIQMSRPFCFEPNNRYVVAIRFQRHGVTHRHLTAFILIDSLVLIPKYTELPGFQGSELQAKQNKEDMVRYMCPGLLHDHSHAPPGGHVLQAHLQHLLHHPQRSSAALAERVKDEANSTKQALSASDKAIEKATAALKEAQSNLNNTQNATAEVDLQLLQLEGKQMDIMMRLQNLSAEAEALRNKTEMNRKMAEDALALANNATLRASSLEQSFNNTEERYKELLQKVESIGDSGSLDSIQQKVRTMKSDAENLLNKAKDGIKQLDNLSNTFKENEDRMQKQLEELEDLKQNATDVRDELRKKMQAFSVCQV
ncbi:Laminin subunit beta-4 [Oryzias melastigma]|uniref:Laminin subunit beta-4 n=1 Tax=Oryzias melastigma TaxID=30732 RepID=A0A834BYQ6_ORYME|nr:Laminin subunit beta-4 [Oryzias melastigma]